MGVFDWFYKSFSENWGSYKVVIVLIEQRKQLLACIISTSLFSTLCVCIRENSRSLIMGNNAQLLQQLAGEGLRALPHRHDRT